jgi:hypothetical protein
MSQAHFRAALTTVQPVPGDPHIPCCNFASALWYFTRANADDLDLDDWDTWEADTPPATWYVIPLPLPEGPRHATIDP